MKCDAIFSFIVLELFLMTEFVVVAVLSLQDWKIHSVWIAIYISSLCLLVSAEDEL